MDSYASSPKRRAARLLCGAGLALLLSHAPAAMADAVIEWNEQVAAVVAESKLGTPPAVRLMAILQTAVLGALENLPHAASNEVAQRAAVAAAHRDVLVRLLPAQEARIEAAYWAAIQPLPDGPVRAHALGAGHRAALSVLHARADDGAATAEAYRPHTSAGAYVPTALPAATQWAQRRPWLMREAAQFRPPAPPALDSERWAADLNEVKAIGARQSTRRTPEQTDAARFWEHSLPDIYQGVLRSVARQDGRDALHHARLFAAASVAMDDALIAAFEAKYHHRFWRPITAIRNADVDGHAGTARDPSWLPLIDTPMHPEYPSAHGVLASAMATVLAAQVAPSSTIELSTRSPSAGGAARRWRRLEDFVREVGDARVHAGLHFRFSTEAAETLGRQVGALAVARLLHADR